MLAIDCGNSRLKWACFDAGRKGATSSFPVGADSFEFERAVQTLDKPIDRVLVSNVAGVAVAGRIGDAVAERFGIEAEFVAVTGNAHGIECGYREPGTLGVDRWLAMIAARRLAGGPLVVVGVGTAVTIDVVDADGRHLGGLILPGDGLMIDALASNTAGIEQVARAGTAREGLALLGRSTAESVGHGGRLALAASVDRITDLASAAFGTEPALWLTGGDAELLTGWLASDASVRADLVLEGLAAVAESTEDGSA